MTIPSVLPSKKEGVEEKLQRRVKKASGRKELIKYSQKMTLVFKKKHGKVNNSQNDSSKLAQDATLTQAPLRGVTMRREAMRAK